jgi:hypothetical protein
VLLGLVEEDFQNERPSLLLATISNECRSYLNYYSLLEKIFSLPYDVTSEYLRIHESRLKVVGKKSELLDYKLRRASIPRLAQAIGMEYALAKWTILDQDAKNRCLIENSRNFLMRAIQIDSPDCKDSRGLGPFSKDLINFCFSRKGREFKRRIGFDSNFGLN